jgi:hypothetical protein
MHLLWFHYVNGEKAEQSHNKQKLSRWNECIHNTSMKGAGIMNFESFSVETSATDFA